MDKDRFNMALREFLKEVGVTSQREVERLPREHAGKATRCGCAWCSRRRTRRR